MVMLLDELNRTIPECRESDNSDEDSSAVHSRYSVVYPQHY